MKFGIYLPNFGPFGDARLLAELARDAENSGWEGFFLWDHMAASMEIPALPMADPWVALAAVALNTQKIRIGTTVTPLPRRRPWKLARETVSLDHLSGGRLTLGVGTGLGPGEWDDLGEETSHKRRGAMLDEGLQVLAGLWSGDPFCFDGQFYHIRRAQFLPRPVQQPRLPVWVGGFWPYTAPFRRAAHWDGAVPLFEADTEEQELAQLAEVARFLSEARPGAARPLDLICTGITPGDDRTQAAQIIRPRSALGATWWLEAIAPYRLGHGFDGEWPVEALRRRILQGPPV